VLQQAIDNLAMEHEIQAQVVDGVDGATLIFEQWDRKVVKTEEGLIVKYGASVSLYEADVMRYVASNTTVPIPKIHHSFTHNHINYIVMDEAPGVSLKSVWDGMSEATKKSIAQQILEIISQLQSITSTFIGGIHGESCPDFFFDCLAPTIVGGVEKFYNAIETVLHPRHNSGYSVLLLDGLKQYTNIVFTHSDLVPRNIHVMEDKVISVLDWEQAGFYPEYWEYHKCLYAVDWTQNSWAYTFLKLIPTDKKISSALMSTIRGFIH